MPRRLARVRGLCALLAILVLTSIPVMVEASPAILVVGNAKNQIMTGREKEALEILARFRDKLGLDDNALPILSYHFNKADERAYCESTLGIKATNLLFVGLVEHEDRAARKVVTRINAVTDPYSACLQVMTAAARRVGRDPSVLRTAVSPPTTPTPNVTPTSGRALSFLRIDVVNKSSDSQTRFTGSDAGVFFHVYLHNNHTSRAHRHTLKLEVLGPDGTIAFEPVLGGSFEVSPGEVIDAINMIKRADNDHATGYAIAGKTTPRAGIYTAVATLDGAQVGRASFEIQASAVSGGRGGVEISDAYLIDYDGNRRESFSTADRGAYAVVFLRNTATSRQHSHTFRLLCFGPDAKPYGKPLGGSFTVEVGQDLSKKSLPRDVDANRANGYRIKDNQMAENPGTYRFVIEIDGQAVKTLYFQVNR